MGSGLPSPPLEDHKSQASRKTSSSHQSTKAIKPNRHTSKRASPHSATAHHDHVAHGMADGRHKRVWKACERCRMKKTKCDGEFPCKRCKDDGLVCTAGVRKKTEYKQLPKGYAEVLEHTQFALVATVHKLYAMVRSGQQWDLGEPELNDRGQPVIHNIASKLGCIRPNSDIDLPVHSVFPEDEGGMAELARQLEEQQQKERESLDIVTKTEMESQSSCNLSDRSSPSEQDHSDFEVDYRRQVFGGGNVMTMSPQSFGGYDGIEMESVPSPIDAAAMFPSRTQPMTGYPPQWATAPRVTSMDLSQQYLPTNAPMNGMDFLSQGLMDSEFGTIKPHMLSSPNPEVMMGMGDPMMFSGFDTEPMRL